jgi:hypothetical protein
METALQEFKEDGTVDDSVITANHQPNAVPYFHLRWSYGDPPERSHPSQRSQYLSAFDIFQKSDDNVITTADFNTGEAIDSVSPEYTRLFGETSGMREEQNEVLAGRALIRQTGVNPFFGKNQYLQDLEIQGQFLRPRNSNYEANCLRNRKAHETPALEES